MKKFFKKLYNMSEHSLLQLGYDENLFAYIEAIGEKEENFDPIRVKKFLKEIKNIIPYFDKDSFWIEIGRDISPIMKLTFSANIKDSVSDAPSMDEDEFWWEDEEEGEVFEEIETKKEEIEKIAKEIGKCNFFDTEKTKTRISDRLVTKRIIMTIIWF